MNHSVTYQTHPPLVQILRGMGLLMLTLSLAQQLLAQDGLTSGGPLKPEQAIMDIRH
jgi:hypothetical protein